MDSKIPVSVVVSVKNEEKNLPSCLEVLDVFSEVLVVDSLSTDRTPQIAQSYSFVQYVPFEWNGVFPKKRNWVLRNVSLKNDWVLFLDADEVLTQDFVEELRLKIQDSGYVAFRATYANVFMGKVLKHGDPMTKLPLFKKTAGEYEKIEEDYWSHLDMEIHEHPVVDGKIGHMKAQIIHHDYKGLEQYIARHNAYSSWEARRYVDLKKNGAGGHTFRQKMKYGLLNTGLLPFVYFVGAYFLKLGFLDGRAGLNLAMYKAYYFFQIRTKIQELEKSNKSVNKLV